MNGSGASHWTEVSAPDEDWSSYMTGVEWLLDLGIYHPCSRVELGRKIAEGGQATIYEARVDYPPFCSRSHFVIVKKFKALPGVSQGHFPIELLNYGNVFVCKPFGFYFDPDDMSLCMIMDRYSGDLRELIDSQMKLQKDGGAPFTERVAVSIIVQLAMGLRSLHGNGICHRDLKCQNILVDRSMKRLISSSGASDMKFAIAISDFETSEDVHGTGFWRAPEILQCVKERVPFSGIEWQAADIYSFGMTRHEILTGRSPCHDKKATDYNHVLSGGRPELPANIHEGLRDIIQRCWDRDLKARPTIAEIVPLLKQIDQFSELWEVGFSKVENLMSWKSSLPTPDARLLELFRLVDIDREVFGGDAYKYVVNVEEFVSKFGWKSYDSQPSLPFAKFVERERLSSIMYAQFDEACKINNSRKKRFLDELDAGYERETLIFMLMEKLFFNAANGYLECKYSGQDDEVLTLNVKFIIILKDFVQPLLDARVDKICILQGANRILHEELWKEDRPEEVEIFQVLLLIIMTYSGLLGSV